MEEREVVDWLRLSLLLVENDVLNRFSRLAKTAKSEILVRMPVTSTTSSLI
jgi:hypothetical protein